MLVGLVYKFSKRQVLKSSKKSPESARDADQSAYRAWRHDTVEHCLAQFDTSVFQDADVLDFGCNTGELCSLIAKLGARSCIGVDLGEKGIAAAKASNTDPRVSFAVGSETQIPLPSESVDVITCFDVVEHIMQYEPIFREWRRILRHGGKVLIDWQPYYHPFGHHSAKEMPVPWAHVFLTHREQREVCARIVDLPQFDAPYWDYDASGKRINRYREAIEMGCGDNPGFLNELTTWKFERLCRQIGFTISRRFVAFGGPWPVRLVSSVLAKIPRARDFFSAKAIYILESF